MEVLRQEWMNTLDRRRRTELLERIRETGLEIVSAPDAAPAQKLHARLNLMIAEGEDLVGRFLSISIRIRARGDMGFQTHQGEWNAARELAAACSQWDKNARSLIQEAESQKHPLLLAEAVTARLYGYQDFLSTERKIAVTDPTPSELDAALCKTLAREAEQVIEVFRRAGSREGETRAKLLLADFHYLLGDRASATALAEEALVVAQAMSYSRLASHAKEYTEGPTSFEEFQATIKARRAQDEDVLQANDSDERLRELAVHSLETMHLPADRLPVVEREWQSLRLISRERLGWCRYINLKQDQAHMLDPSTRYVTDPPRFCVCEKHGYEASIRHPDPETVINAFKRAYCDECRDRSPKADS
jgi:hypothetical protein